MDKEPKRSVKKILTTALIIVLIIILGLGIYLYLDREKGRLAEVTAKQGKSPEIPKPAVTVPSEVQAPDAGQKPEPVDVCSESRKKLQGLFAYLDKQDYVAAQRLPGGSFEHFKGLLARLLDNPPFIQRETDALMRVLQNKAHFYRILGKENTRLLRDIFRNEGAVMESSFAILYQAMILQEKCGTDGSALQAPLNKVYPYAVYFLNTLGGSAYLIRRDSRVRMLTQYYCILILDQANRGKLNKQGLDIRPHIDTLVRDLKGTANLSRKKEYIETLNTIGEKY